MTTLTVPRSAAGQSSPVLRTTRATLVNWRQIAMWPWAIFASALAVNLVIFTVLSRTNAEPGGTGGLASIFIVMLVMGVDTTTSQFSFAMGLSATRTTYLRASWLFYAGTAAVFGTVLFGLYLVERATDGWFISLQFMAPPFLDLGNPIGQWAAYVSLMLLMPGAGMLVGAIYKRWGIAGIYAAGIGLMVVAAAIVTLLAVTGAGPGFWTSLVTMPLAVAWIVLPLAVTAMCTLGTHAVMRRAVP